MKYQKLKKEAFHSMCRQCINEQYGLQLKTRDCYYLPYQELCSCCGNIKNIVADISRHSRWRLFFARQKETVNHSNLLYHRRNKNHVSGFERIRNVVDYGVEDIVE